MRAAIQKFNLVGIVLLCLSGATPAPVEVSGWEPDDGALVQLGCPGGSCDGRRPC